jgi:hypothetical protein
VSLKSTNCAEEAYVTVTAHVAENEQCVRCHAVAPDPASPEFLEWDPVGDEDMVICPRCSTEAEEQAL